MRKVKTKISRPVGKKASKNTPSPTDRELSKILCLMLDALSGVTTTRHMGHTSFCAGKKVFAFTRNSGVALKLPGARAEHLVRDRTAEFLVMGKRIMKEWIVIEHESPEEYLADLNLFAEARDFVEVQQNARCADRRLK